MLQAEASAAAATAAASQVQRELQVQLTEQAAELAAARVDAENKAAQVCGHVRHTPWVTSILVECSKLCL
jgi:hypothetical protein